MRVHDPFRCVARKEIPPDEYWEVADELAATTLKFDHAPSIERINDRVAELSLAEDRLGVVYEGELLWLLALRDKTFAGEYSDWVLLVLNESLLDQRLRWAAYNDRQSHTSAEYLDVWAGPFTRNQLVPCRLIPDFDITPILAHMKLAVYGTRDAPSKLHLIQLFERLHNQPYYIQCSKQAMIDQWDDTENGIIEISVINREDPEKWTIWQDNMYSAVSKFQMRGRQPHAPWDNDITKDDRVLLEKVRNHLRETTGRDETPLDAYNVAWADGDRLWIYNHLDSFSKTLREELRTKLFSTVETPDGVFIEGGATLLDADVECCGITSRRNLSFNWGTRRGFPQYRMGDLIRWDVPKEGYPGIASVFVVGQREDECPQCGNDQPLICIRDDRITSVRSKDAMYLGPFVQDTQLAEMWRSYGFEDCVTWKEFLPRWLYQQVITAANKSNCSEFELLSAGLEDKYKSAHPFRRLGDRGIAWLHYKYRHLWTIEHYLRAMDHCSANFHGLDELGPTKDSDVKSIAILHYEVDGKQGIAGFHWGDLLNFPEYRIGDEIRWSDYAMGERTNDAVFANYRILIPPYDPPYDKIENAPGYIRIENNIIVGLDRGPDVEETLGTYPHSACAYVGRKPWMIWPDDDILK
ncbi:MAG: hypothetical protein AAF497_13205 [Planctomycetota bacterium]